MKDENQVFVSYGHVEEEMCKDEKTSFYSPRI